MTNPSITRRRPRPSEEGYALLWVIFLLAVFIIAMSVAVPKVTREIQRDREIETMQRGKQYIRGIRMYYKKFNAYPPSIDALVKTNNIRFLRKKYVDLTTGKEEWKAIHFGQNKAPTAMGFFGKPLVGSTLAGIGASGGNSISGATSLGSSFMSSNSPSSGSTLATGTASGTGDASSTTGNTGITSATGTTGAPGTTGATGATNSSSSASASGSSTSGQTFGGLGIIGFSPNSPNQSILIYKTKNHYNEWEFVYDPITEQMLQGGNTGTIGQSAASAFSPTASPSSTSGSSTNSTSPTGSSSTTFNPTSPTTTTPQ
jgi:type II secretory pathway pseudopilin PulG